MLDYLLCRSAVFRQRAALSHLRPRAECDSFVENKNCEMSSKGEQLPEAALTHCTKERGLVVIPMPVQPMFVGTGQFLSSV